MLTALLLNEQAELDEAKRLDLVKQIQRLASDQMYYAPAVSSIVNSFYQPWLENRFVTNDYTTGLERNAYLSINRT
jgi:ABC-type transport system substrate-binding protein